MAQQVRAFAIKAGNLNLIPGTYVDEGENELPRIVLCSPLACYGVCVCPLTGTLEHI